MTIIILSGIIFAIFIFLIVKFSNKGMQTEASLEAQRELITIHYLIIYPVFTDASQWNLSKYGLKIHNIKDAEFVAIFDQDLKDRVKDSQLRDIELIGAEKYCYVIMEERKKDASKNMSQEFLTLLSIIKPSEVKPICDFNINYYQENEINKRWQITSSTIYQSQNISQNYKDALIINEKHNLIYMLFDSFLKIEQKKHLQHLVDVYISAIRLEQLYLRYLMFMMMAEMLVKDDSTSGVTYKIRRVIAVLLGTDMKQCDVIFQNMNNLYAVRSQIVHSAVTDKLTKDKIQYMHTVACEILNTFMLGEVDLSSLFSNSTKYGFGQRKHLLNDYGVTVDDRFDENLARLIEIVPK